MGSTVQGLSLNVYVDGLAVSRQFIRILTGIRLQFEQYQTISSAISLIKSINCTYVKHSINSKEIASKWQQQRNRDNKREKNSVENLRALLSTSTGSSDPPKN